MGIKTSNFTTMTVGSFYESVLEEHDFYVMGSDVSLSNTSVDSNFSNRQVLEKAIFGIRVESENIRNMITNTIWEPGVVYTMYDDQAILGESNFYVVVEPEEITGDYHVFKCLFNNNGGTSSSKPLYDETIVASGGESNLADGYIWKYLFTVPYSTVKRFKTRGYFPIEPNEAVMAAAVDGISTILVENFNTNYGYKKIVGYLNSAVVNGRVFLSISEGYTFDFAANIYSGKSFYISFQDGDVIAAKQYEIAGSGKQGNLYYVDIIGFDDADFDDDIIANYGAYEFQILPRVVIQGTGTEAEGIAIFDETNTRINSIQIITRGSEYVDAVAEVIRPAYLNPTAGNGDVEAILRVIIPPRNGHGYDVPFELRSKAVCISTTIDSETTEVPSSNYYSKLALVLNPHFSSNTVPETFDNRLALDVSTTTGIEVGMTVTQSSGVSGIVHEIIGDTVYLVEYLGPYVETFDAGLPLSLGSIDINIDTVTESEYIQRTGDVLYVTDFEPVERTSDKTELIKILIDF